MPAIYTFGPSASGWASEERTEPKETCTMFEGPDMSAHAGQGQGPLRSGCQSGLTVPRFYRGSYSRQVKWEGARKDWQSLKGTSEREGRRLRDRPGGLCWLQSRQCVCLSTCLCSGMGWGSWGQGIRVPHGTKCPGGGSCWSLSLMELLKMPQPRIGRPATGVACMESVGP